MVKREIWDSEVERDIWIRRFITATRFILSIVLLIQTLKAALM